MTTAYNLNSDKYRALEASRADLLDPGANGTVIVYPHTDATVTLSNAGSPSLQTATNLALNTRITVFAQAAVTIEGVTLADGEFAEFMISSDSAGANEWVNITSSSTIAGANVEIADDNVLALGNLAAGDARLGWHTNDASTHTVVMALSDTTQSIHFTDVGAEGTDWAVAADTHPTLYIHSNTTPATDYLRIGAHDGTTAIIDVVGGTTLAFAIAGATDFTMTAGALNVLSGSDIIFATNSRSSFGAGSVSSLSFRAEDSDNNTLVLSLADANQAIHITDDGARGTDWNIAATTHPNVYIHSNTTPSTDYLRLGDHDGTTAYIDVVGGTTLALEIGGVTSLSMTTTGLTAIATVGFLGQGSTSAELTPTAAQQALSGAGAINITTAYTAWTTTGADAGTLADGAQLHQVKKIQLIVDGGDGTLTPTNLSGGTTIVFADAGDFAILKWDGTNWVAIELGNGADGATAPVLA